MAIPRRSSRWSLWLTLGLIAMSVLSFVAFVDLGAVAAQLRAADWRYMAAASGALLARPPRAAAPTATDADTEPAG